MGNQITTTIHHPNEMVEIYDKFKIIPILMSNNRSLIYGTLKEITYDLIIIICSNELSSFNYSEISSRLSANKKIVVCVKIKSIEKKNPLFLCADYTKYDTVILNIIKNLKNDFVINYTKKLTIGSITLCPHNSSHNICINELVKKYNVIMIDPLINVNYGTQSKEHKIESFNLNLYAILSCDHINIAKASQYLKNVTNNIIVLSNVTSSNFYNLCVSNLKEINEKSIYWNLITKTILDIISVLHKQKLN